MAKHSVVPELSTLRAVLASLQDESGDHLTDATVQIIEITHRGEFDPLDTLVFPIGMAYVPGTPSQYRAIIPATAGLTAGRWYEARIVATGAAGQVRRFTERIRVTDGAT